jgi:hypothetical protein
VHVVGELSADADNAVGGRHAWSRVRRGREGA